MSQCLLLLHLVIFKTRNMLKKQLLKLSLVLLASCIYSGLFAQTTEPQVYKEWQMLDESKTMIDVSYRVLKCSETNQIHLMIFNENVIDQNAQFSLEVTDETSGQKLVKDFDFATTKATMYKADCSNNTLLSALKFALPSDYDPAKLSVKLTFKP